LRGLEREGIALRRAPNLDLVLKSLFKKLLAPLLPDLEQIPAIIVLLQYLSFDLQENWTVVKKV